MPKSVMNRHKPGDWVVSPPDEFHPPVGVVGFSNAMTPDDDELRRMLLELRKTFRWPQSFAAGVLGVTTSAVVKWESGARKPAGAAAKLIFLLHSLMLDKSGKVANVWDLATWGRIPCRHAFQQAAEITKALELGETWFLRSEEMEQIADLSSKEG